MKKEFTKEVKIALVAIVGIIVLFFGIKFLKGMNLFSNDDTYYMTFRNIAGLGTAAPIYADGYKVGTVKSIQYNYAGNGPIRVKIGVEKGMRIPLGSRAEIQKDIMGNMQVDILMANNPANRIEPGQVIPGIMDGGVMAKVQGMVPSIEKMMPKIDSILTGLNALVSNPALARSLHNIQVTSSNLALSSRQLNILITGLNQQVPGLIRRADGTLDNANGMMVNGRKFTDNLASLNIQKTMSQINATLEQVYQLSEKLNDEKGTLGKLMKDPALYDNMNATMRSADSLLINIKAHPKRYVHFSVFGKKDK
ncbi:MAG: MlaD family protein [Prevotella sp.]|jgi:phospholipid/cholesterol/gamma-HCH transport system substrate-binding protein|nr:MlaD family protein [Prevotella sp.]MCH3986203.1 MlaD family protein [Prevotella sp.]MCH3991395.1 MlaD family protein [Prevotella sp.]MCH4018571.1 MlaD family protein [Prevotella sp.]MCH4100319.1 MlaD family protein [Prevotella sp.]